MLELCVCSQLAGNEAKGSPELPSQQGTTAGGDLGGIPET